MKVIFYPFFEFVLVIYGSWLIKNLDFQILVMVYHKTCLFIYLFFLLWNYVIGFKIIKFHKYYNF